MDYRQYKRIYFIGIGGIGMSALARYFLAGGFTVAGYDRTVTELTRTLAHEGCHIHFQDDILSIPDEYLHESNRATTLVIFTPAIPHDHNELNYFRKYQYTVLKRSEVLGEISRNLKSIAVAGTHGKTTVSTMIAHLLKQSEINCTAFLGGISKNYNSNLIMGSGAWAVLEADEFDRSFLQLTPHIAVITSMDPDHLDVYHEKNMLQQSFNLFADKISPKGILLVKKTVDPDILQREDISRYTYTFDGEADFYPKQVHLQEGFHVFDMVVPGKTLKNIRLGYAGKMNVENAVAAIAVAWLLDVPEDVIRRSMVYFRGVIRRFDLRYTSDSIAYIDDYAHHPEELRACIASVRELYPGKNVSAIFQPHLYTRTRDFYIDFAKNLDLLDEVILLDIYPARENPIEGIRTEIILEEMKNPNAQIMTKAQAMEYIKTIKTDVLLTLGAGDIDQLVGPIEEALRMRDENMQT